MILQCNAMFPRWPYNLLKFLNLIGGTWFIKELTMTDRIFAAKDLAQIYLVTKYLEILAVLQKILSENYIVINTMTIIAVFYSLYRLITFIEGRHRTLNTQTLMPPSQNSTNNLYFHNSRQQSETRSNNHHQNINVQLPQHTDDVKVSTWLNLLELHFKYRSIADTDWTQQTILLLTHKLLDKIGDFGQYENNSAGYAALKSVLTGIPIPTQTVSKSFVLDNLPARKQLKGESAATFGHNLQLMAKGILKNDDHLKELYCRGLSNKDVQRQVAYFISNGKEKNCNFSKMVQYAADYENSWEKAENYIINSCSSSDTDNQKKMLAINDSVTYQNTSANGTTNGTKVKYCFYCKGNGHWVSECTVKPRHQNNHAQNNNNYKQQQQKQQPQQQQQQQQYPPPQQQQQSQHQQQPQHAQQQQTNHYQAALTDEFSTDENDGTRCNHGVKF
jgi:hypothetical protein